MNFGETFLKQQRIKRFEEDKTEVQQKISQSTVFTSFLQLIACLSQVSMDLEIGGRRNVNFMFHQSGRNL